MFPSHVTISQVLSGLGCLCIMGMTCRPKDLLNSHKSDSDLGTVSVALEELALCIAECDVDHTADCSSSLLAVPIERDSQLRLRWFLGL